MTDSAENDIMDTIRGLIDEEHALRATSGGLGAGESARMKKVEEALDQCWDLLRQRRARSEFGQDPDEAEIRPVSEVENYPQ